MDTDLEELTYHLLENETVNTNTNNIKLSLKNNLKIIHQNIRSINKNFEGFLINLKLINIEFDIMILTECWIKNSYTPKNIEGYYCINTSYNTKQNDGIVVYIKNNLKTTTKEIKINDANCLHIQATSVFDILAIYRSPSAPNITNFLTSLETVLHKLKHCSNLFLIGDTNINILENGHPQRDDYLNAISYYGLVSYINQPTRVTEETLSCIDHVIGRTKQSINTIIYESTVTDHYSTILEVENDNTRKDNSVNISIMKNKIDWDTIIFNIKNEKWENLYSITDNDMAWNYFTNFIQNQINLHTNQKEVPNKKNTITKPWITPGLLKCIRKRDNIHKQIRNDPNNYLLTIFYKKYRNICTKLIKHAKNKYYSRKIIECNNDSRKIWQTLKEITHAKQFRSQIDELTIDGQSVNFNLDPKTIADHANTFFTNIGSKLASKIQENINCNTKTPPSDDNPREETYKKFTLKEVLMEDIIKEIDSLKERTSPGYDKIPCKLLKSLKSHIAVPLKFLINKSFTQGCFPNVLKQGIISPIFKGGDKTEITNYRPICVLSALSKIVEGILRDQLTTYLDSSKILSANQFGFRQNLSTSDAIANVTDFITSNVDRGNKCLAIFLDLAKAFDTVNHKILLDKLKRIGISDTVLQLFHSYLTDRTQCVKINSTYSRPQKTVCGVPQGSILGPLLFLIYINDLCNLQNCGQITTFADDTVLIFYAKSWDEVFKMAENGFRIVKNWLDAHILTLNTDKTKFLTFRISNKLLPSHQSLKLHSCNPLLSPCTCPSISRVDSIKYLGIQIDDLLKWKVHVINLTTKLRKLVYFFKIVRDILNRKQLKQVYCALIQSSLEYGIISWGSASNTCLEPLEKIQKLILKVILKVPLRTSTDFIFKTLNVLNLKKLYSKNILLHQFKNTHMYEERISTRALRESHVKSFNIPVCQTSYGQRSFKYNATKLFNSLPINIRNTQTKSSFKSKIIDYLQ